MAGRWTQERRERQQQMMLTLKPWLKSTGAKTQAGKRRVSQNRHTTGKQSQWYVEIQQTIAQADRMARESLSRLDDQTS